MNMNPLLAGGLIVAVACLAKPLLNKLRLHRVPSFVLKNDTVEVHISSLGGIIQRLFVAGKHGQKDDIVLGHDKLSDYLVEIQGIPCT
jgi:hypothetical protein